MSGSLSRITVAFVLVLALFLSTVPAQALPGDPGSRLSSLDTSWFEAALSWVQGLLGGGRDSDSLQAMTTGGTNKRPVSNSSSCVDPMGKPIDCPPENPGP